MTSDTSTIDNAWEDFKEKRSFEKATSIQGQLDTMAAMLQDIQTNTQRTASVVDQINGDNAAIEYENENADPMAGMDMGMPAEEPMPEEAEAESAEEPMPEEESSGEVEESAGEDVPVEGSEMPTEGAAPTVMPEEGPGEVAGEPEPVGEDIGELLETEAPAEEGPSGFEPAANDMVGKIKNLIASTDDPTVLAGLSDLLSSALAQNQPAPMEAEPLMKAADVNNDGEEVMREELSGAVDSTLGVGFAKADDGIASAKDSEDAEDAVSPETEDGPEAETSFAESGDEVEEKVEIAEEEGEPMPEAESPEQAIAEEIADKVEEAVEGIVESVLNGDEPTEGEPATEDISEETESFEECDKPAESVMKSFADMLAERPHIGVDGKSYIAKADCRAATDDDYKGPFKGVKEQMAAEDQKKEEVKEKFADVERPSGDVPAFTKSAEDGGKHIASFEELYAAKGGFSKSGAENDISRPGRTSMVNGVTDKPTLDPIKKSALPSFEQMLEEKKIEKASY